MKKPKFAIGQWVKVSAIAVRRIESEKEGFVFGVPERVWWESRDCPVSRFGRFSVKLPFYGRIVGATYKQVGKIRSDGPVDSTTFEQTERPVLLWKVAASYLGKPILVFEEGLQTIGMACAEALPWSPSNRFWTEREREDMSREMKRIYQEQPGLFPRDEKGRFRKSK